MTRRPSDPAPTRVVIDRVLPEVDGGRYPAKTSLGERFRVVAHVFADGHDELRVDLEYRASEESAWNVVAMTPRGNDEWVAEFRPGRIGAYEYCVRGWIDHYGTWLADLEKRVAAGWEVDLELRQGAEILGDAVERASDPEIRRILQSSAAWLGDSDLSTARRIEIARDGALRRAADVGRDVASDAESSRALPLWVDRERARFGSWYEMFPRSVTDDPKRSGTLGAAAGRLPAIASMGMDVVYLPPIHPIGETGRKGPNNTLEASGEDPGSPWAIGSAAGGHTAVHPDLGTLEDFESFVREAAGHGLEVALDLAFQCSPDHPWVTEHPSWFRHRPDGSIRFAENPPKQYQDIYPIDFETEDWEALWTELFRTTMFWVDRGVRIFRVDNPHTKPFPFWEWLIRSVHEQAPDVIFLAEAFTRPKRMAALAKLGFSQSYSYFTWRNTKEELTDYLSELTRPPLVDVMRPNLFVNTPDILHEYLQRGGRPAFLIRLALAATLGPSYGIYSGYELIERTSAAPGSEEYLDSEKFEIKPRDWDAPGNITGTIAAVNRIRREHRALQFNHELWFLPVQNDQVLAYLKSDPDGGGHVLTVVSLDPHVAQTGWVGLPLEALELRDAGQFAVRELLAGEEFTWTGEWNAVHLTPERPAHIYVFGEALTPDDPRRVVFP